MYRWEGVGRVPLVRNGKSAVAVTTIEIELTPGIFLGDIGAAKIKIPGVKGSDINKRVINPGDQAGGIEFVDDIVAREPGWRIYHKLEWNRADLVPQLDLPPVNVSGQAMQPMKPTIGIILVSGTQRPSRWSEYACWGFNLGLDPTPRAYSRSKYQTAGGKVGVGDRSLKFERRAEKLRQGRYNVALRISRPDGQIIEGFVANRELWFGCAAEQGVVVVSSQRS